MISFEELIGRAGPPAVDPWTRPRPIGTDAVTPVVAAPDPGRVRFKAGVLVVIAAVFASLLLIQRWLWPSDIRARTVSGRVMRDLCWFWVLNSLPAFVGVIGMLTQRRRRPVLPATMQPIGTTVCFRVVTRGTNVRAVVATVQSIGEAMAALPLFPHRVEVVSDRHLPTLAAEAAEMIVVPPTYVTRSGALFKARALQYALERSDLPDDAWILHLDEESRIDASTVIGIRHAVEEEERSGEHRIGQGMILYHRDLPDHPVLTLADSMRTGDDLGRFSLQHRFGLPLFGLHGSFILVRCDVERQVGFDFGPAGSITEDAYWALLEMHSGRRTRWVDGVIIEQSTQSVRDFLKQRRRWFVGLVKTIVHAPVGLRHKFTLAVCMAVWAVSWLSIVSAVALACGRASAPPAAFVIGAGSFSVFVAQYIVGLHLNLAHRGATSWPRRASLYVVQVAFIPIFSILEASGVLYALLRPESGFHVVKK